MKKGVAFIIVIFLTVACGHSKSDDNSKYATYGKDSHNIPIINIEDVPVAADWFSADWEPYATTFAEHRELLVPQIQERSLTFQDLTAPYFFDYSPEVSFDYTPVDSYPEISKMRYVELYAYLQKKNITFNQFANTNLAYIRTIAKMQDENMVILSENAVYQIDLDNDGIMEEIELQAKSIACEAGLLSETIKEYALFINGILMGTFRNTKLELSVLNVGTCKVLNLHFAGYFENHADSIPRPGDYLYGFFDHKPVFLGELNGRQHIVLQNGLFVTEGVCEPCGRFTSPIFRFLHLYYVEKGELYHVSIAVSSKSEGWQQKNSAWLLDKDLPVYEYNESIGIMKKGTKVLICGISEKGNLYLVNENGQTGFITLLFDGESGEELNPVVEFSGLRLAEYFADYAGYAYAG